MIWILTVSCVRTAFLTFFPDCSGASRYDQYARSHTVADHLQNYLVYTNSLVFIRSGAKSRATGVLLAGVTLVVLFIFPSIIGLIPIFVVSTLIFTLGFELLREALLDTWEHLSTVEYLTVSNPITIAFRD